MPLRKTACLPVFLSVVHRPNLLVGTSTCPAYPPHPSHVVTMRIQPLHAPCHLSWARPPPRHTTSLHAPLSLKPTPFIRPACPACCQNPPCGEESSTRPRVFSRSPIQTCPLHPFINHTLACLSFGQPASQTGATPCQPAEHQSLLFPPGPPSLPPIPHEFPHPSTSSQRQFLPAPITSTSLREVPSSSIPTLRLPLHPHPSQLHWSLRCTFVFLSVRGLASPSIHHGHVLCVRSMPLQAFIPSAFVHPVSRWAAIPCHSHVVQVQQCTIVDSIQYDSYNGS